MTTTPDAPAPFRAPTCRCCRAREVTLLGTKSGRFIRRDFTFYRCPACTFIFVEPVTGPEIYNDAYYQGSGPDPYVDYETEYRDWHAADRGLEFADLARIAAEYFAAPSSRAPIAWLDFGCGAGGLLKFLRERGEISGQPLRLTGHDVGSYAELLARTDGFRILDFDALLREPDAQYDVISMIEVLEHLADPKSALALVARLLKPGGLLLLTTGNLDALPARTQGLRYHYCAPEIHVSLFNPPCLSRLYREVGLAPHRVRYRGTVAFKVVKTLRHHPALRGLAHFVLRFGACVRVVDWLYGVSAMPCAVKSGRRP